MLLLLLTKQVTPKRTNLPGMSVSRGRGRGFRGARGGFRGGFPAYPTYPTYPGAFVPRGFYRGGYRGRGRGYAPY